MLVIPNLYQLAANAYADYKNLATFVANAPEAQ